MTTVEGSAHSNIIAFASSSSSAGTSAVGVSPVTARFPHTSETPPTSPVILPPIYEGMMDPSLSDRSFPGNAYAPHSSGSASASGSAWGPRSPPLSNGADPCWSKSHGGEPVPGAGTGHRRMFSVEEGGLPGPEPIGSSTHRGKSESRLRPPPISGPHGNANVQWKRRISDAGDAALRSGSTVQRLRRSLGARVNAGLKKRNLPFLIVFAGCLVIFFSALAGFGYRPTGNAARSSGSDLARAQARFQLGRPVYESLEDRQQVMEERRRVEEGWAKMKRPKDGAWMKKERDDGAIRRKGGGAGARGKAAKHARGVESVDESAR